MIRRSLTVFIPIILTACGLAEKSPSTEKNINGDFVVEMQLNDSTVLPFNLRFTKHNNKPIAEVLNADESILIEDLIQKGDSLIISMPVFGSQLSFKILDTNNLEGVFTSPHRDKSYQIFLRAIRAKNRFSAPDDGIDGKYRIVFNNDSTDKALGLFKTEKTLTYSSFATETGDYRYIEGVVKEGKLKMSCFDGAHAFYFEATVKNDSLTNGAFYSGNHYYAPWYGVKDEAFELSSAYKLTSAIDEEQRILKKVNGRTIPVNGAKITAVQLLGTWCPNCMDESRFYAEYLYPKYHEKGLEIIGLAFEYDAVDSLRKQRVNRFIEDLNIPYPVEIVGKASKTEASEMFPELSKIISFPSTIFLDSAGKILRIHTGFYGPGTGDYYTDYIKETDNFMKEYLD